MSYHYLLDIALILLSTKILGIVTKKFHLPQILGAMLAGLILGPSVLGILKETEFIKQLAELGVIGIMFSAGLGVDLTTIKSVFKSSFMIAFCGVIFPILFGMSAMWIYSGGFSLEVLFIGIIFSATSVAISVETLRELGHLESKTGSAILSAAVIDDVLGIIALSIGMGVKNGDMNILGTLANITMFFVFSIVMGYVVAKVFEKFVTHYKTDMRRFTIFGFVFCLLMAFIAEEFFGISGIIGAFIAGMLMSHNPEKDYIKSRFEVLQYLLFAPMFFASIGLEVVIEDFSINIIILALIFIAVAISSKIIGCGLGARMNKFTPKEAFQIGCGMVARGEVVLILAKSSRDLGIIANDSFTAIIITVIVCAMCAPLLIKFAYRNAPLPELAIEGPTNVKNSKDKKVIKEKKDAKTKGK